MMKILLDLPWMENTQYALCCWGNYGNGVNALQLESLSGEPFCTASINPPGVVLSDEIAIKNWSENEGMEHALRYAGVIEGNPLRYISSGFVRIPVYNLSEQSLAEIEIQRKARIEGVMS